MAQVIDQNTVNQQIAENPYLGMSREDLLKEKANNDAMIAQAKKQQALEAIKKSLSLEGMGNIQNQRPMFFPKSSAPAVIQPIERKTDDINDYIMKEMVRQEIRNPVAGTEKVPVGYTSYGGKLYKTTEDPLVDIRYEMAATKLEGEKQKQETNKLKREERTQKIEDAKDKIITTTQDMLNTIKNVKEGADYFGPYAKIPTFVTSLGGIKGEAYAKRKKWENNLNQLLARKGLDMMLELKNASKAGATGFGQLSNEEGLWLRQASTALTKESDPEEAKKILTEMERLYQKILTGNTPSSSGQGTQNTPTSAGQGGGQSSGFKIISARPIGSQ